MNILVPVQNPKNNPYIFEIYHKLSKDHQISFEVKHFWENNSFEIIHIHWPEELNLFQPLNKKKFERIIEQLKHWQARGTKIVYTRHNSSSHTMSTYNNLYLFLLENSDYVIHLGKESITNYINNKNHKIIDHHIYTTYPAGISKHKAKKKLNINDKFAIIIPGSIRFTVELVKTLLILLPLHKENTYVLFQSWPKTYFFEIVKSPVRILCRYSLLLAFKVSFKRNILINKGRISNDDLSLWLSAADIAIMPRFTNELNSGVVFLCLLYKLKIIGPKAGNIGEVLSDSNNYPVTSYKSAIKKMLYLYDLFRSREEPPSNTISKKWDLETAIIKHRMVYKSLERNTKQE